MACTVLVTGANGMAGRYIVPELLQRGFNVRGHYNRVPGPTVGVDWKQLDFLNALDFASLVDGCDCVIHLAAELSDVTRMQRVNVEATQELIKAAQSCGVRYFGYASSIVVYGSPRHKVVDETSPTIDLRIPIRRQYNAEPYMLEYARTKALAELAFYDVDPTFIVDLYRPAIVADDARLREVRDWGYLRKIAAAYRRTQYISARDGAAAIGHLLSCGLDDTTPRRKIEPFNIADQRCHTFNWLLKKAYATTGDPRYCIRTVLPGAIDMAKDIVKYRNVPIRLPMGMVTFSNAKLLATGFTPPVGLERAVDLALMER